MTPERTGDYAHLPTVPPPKLSQFRNCTLASTMPAPKMSPAIADLLISGAECERYESKSPVSSRSSASESSGSPARPSRMVRSKTATREPTSPMTSTRVT